MWKHFDPKCEIQRNLNNPNRNAQYLANAEPRACHRTTTTPNAQH
jgi:hypothetical protein